MLDPTQLQAVAQSHGLTVSNPQAAQPAAPNIGAAAPSAADAYAKRVGYTPSSSSGDLSDSDVLGQIGTNIGSDFSKRNESIAADKANYQAGKESLPESLLHAAGQTAGFIGDVGVDLIKPAIKPEIKTAVKTGITDAAQTPAGQGLAKAWADFKTAHPHVANVAESTGNIASTLPILKGPSLGIKALDVATEAATKGSKVVEKVVDAGKQGISEATKPAVDAAKSTVQGVKNTFSKAPTVADTIKAVDPGLKGKSGVSAYRQVATGGRTVASKMGWVTEQTLSPSQQATKIGTRLANSVKVGEKEVAPAVALGADPVANLETVSTAFKDTEGRIDTILAGKDPAMVYQLDKQTLGQSLEDIRNTAPRETATIKDSKKAFNDVVDFAQQLLNKSEDTIKGGRDMRIEFDAQARKEYPNAFKEGVIDTKSPAGQAIKQVRDTINEHLYNTAPEGSELRALIQRESDLYRASDAIAPEAFATHGSTKATQLVKFMTNHPYVSLFGAYEAIKHIANPVSGL